MAEAVVENRPPPVRFFCHKCNIEFEHVLQDYTCPFCAMGFIEKLEESVSEEGGREMAGGGAHHTDTDTPQDNVQESPHTINLNDFAFLLHNTSPSSPSDLLYSPPRESRLLQLVQQVVMGGEGGGGVVVLGGGAGGAPHEYVMSGEGLDAIMSQLLWQAESEGPPPLSEGGIASLPEVDITEGQQAQGLQCSICWETFNTGEKVKELPCLHVYHQGCISPWLSLHATCPICRKSLAPPTPSTPPSPSVPPPSHATPPSLAFLFRACGIASPSTSTQPPPTPPPTEAPPRGGSMSDLLNQLVSMSAALGFSIGGPPQQQQQQQQAPPTRPPQPPPPPTNYDSDMDFD